jgi:hypothetical protein
MTLSEVVNRGYENAQASAPAVDRRDIESTLRRANRSLGRKLGRIEWIGSLEAYIRQTAGAMVDGWTLDTDYPVAPPERWWDVRSDLEPKGLAALVAVENRLWGVERGAHATARLTKSKRLPVHLNAIEQPSFASVMARRALGAEANALETPRPRERGFASDQIWKSRDAQWEHVKALAVLPFLTEIASCYASGLFAAASLRRGGEVRTLLIGRPRLRFRRRRLHAISKPAVVWPDGSERWYWSGISVPNKIAENRNDLTADAITKLGNHELQRVAIERIGWQRFLDTAQATPVAQDDYGKLWDTRIRLDGQRVHLVEVVNATAEADGSYRRYFLRVPPDVTTARAAVAWTFGFDNVSDYAVASQS